MRNITRVLSGKTSFLKSLDTGAMPFQKGQSGNPGGQVKTRRQWVKEQERFREAKASWKKLLQIRDDMVLERKEIGIDAEGNPRIVDVVPSIKDYLACCKQILDRAIGLPTQAVELTGSEEGPLVFQVVHSNPVKLNGANHTDAGPGGFEFHTGSK